MKRRIFTKLLFTSVFSLLIVSSAAAAQPEQSHNLSEIDPIDTNFNMENFQILNASSFDLRNGFNFSKHTIYDEGNNIILEWDSGNSEWNVVNADLDLNGGALNDSTGKLTVSGGLETLSGNIDISGNNITNLDTLFFEEGMKINGSINTSGGSVNLDNGSIDDVYSINGGGDQINIEDVLNLNSNSISSLNNLYFDGGAAYIVQESDGDNIYVQADDDGGNRNNYLEIDPDTQTTSIPTGDLDVVSGDLLVSGSTDGVDLDSTGNAITIDGSSRYAVQEGQISHGNIGGVSFDSHHGVGSGIKWDSGDDVALDADDLNSTGGIDDFSAAGDLGMNGDILDGNVENAELSNSGLTVAGNSVSLGGSTGIAHSDLSSKNYNDHHGLGDDLTWDVNDDPSLAGTIDATNTGSVCADGTCDKNNYETFDSGGIGTTNIYTGSGSEIDIQGQIDFNSNNVKNIEMSTALGMNGNSINMNDGNINGGGGLDIGGLSELNSDGSTVHIQHVGSNSRVEIGEDSGTVTTDFNRNPTAQFRLPTGSDAW